MPSLRSCILWCLFTVVGLAAEPPVQSPPPPAVPVPAFETTRIDLRDTLAATTAERDQLLQRVERVEQQRTLLIVVAGLLAIAAGLLVRAKLMAGRSAPSIATAQEEGSDPFPETAPDVLTATTVTMRKNATITIRNGATQREEVTGQVQTRRFFSGEARKVETRKVARRAGAEDTPHEVVVPPVAAVEPAKETAKTNRVTRRITASEPLELTPADATETDLRPSTDRVPRPATSDSAASSQEGPRRPATVRVDHQSDRLDVVEVTVKPGTTGIYRRQAFTLLEVMISLALLATVLSSVIGSIYTMHRTRVMAQEESESQALGRVFVERIMAAPWGSLHDSVAGTLWKANYAVDATAVPLTAQALRTLGVIDQLPALDDLKVFVEYYPQSALENAIRDRQPMVLTNRLGYRDRTMVFRIVIEWHGYDGGTRRHVQLFARSE